MMRVALMLSVLGHGIVFLLPAQKTSLGPSRPIEISFRESIARNPRLKASITAPPLDAVRSTTPTSRAFSASSGVQVTTEKVANWGNRLPDYPEEALRAHWEGTVTLKLFLSREGQVDSVSILTTSGRRVLDRAAWLAARDWRLPAELANPDGIEVPVEFSIQD